MTDRWYKINEQMPEDFVELLREDSIQKLKSEKLPDTIEEIEKVLKERATKTRKVLVCRKWREGDTYKANYMTAFRFKDKGKWIWLGVGYTATIVAWKPIEPFNID